MKNQTSRLAAIAFAGAVLFLAGCRKSDDTTKPKPVVSTTSTTMSLIQDTTGVFTANISAAAGIKDVTITVDNSTIATAEITNKADLTGKTVGTANITVTSSFLLGTANITITVTDNAAQ